MLQILSVKLNLLLLFLLLKHADGRYKFEALSQLGIFVEVSFGFVLSASLIGIYFSLGGKVDRDQGQLIILSVYLLGANLL